MHLQKKKEKKRNLLPRITKCKTRLAISEYISFFFKSVAELLKQMWREDLCSGREKYSGVTLKGRILRDANDKKATLVTPPYSPESRKQKDIIHLCFPIRICLAVNLRTNTVKNKVANPILL